ncbi:hypothetical protein CDAR_238881 [Caerostris darwini]|uniref:Uncharacterized protein n=1 Tax=Caerostris darwini TaxID=1538125 RepID=A0AAV4PQG5_9ARAC|nr:hypothetical protein CDAR_238881 [Caerostris darwini]
MTSLEFSPWPDNNDDSASFLGRWYENPLIVRQFTATPPLGVSRRGGMSRKLRLDANNYRLLRTKLFFRQPCVISGQGAPFWFCFCKKITEAVFGGALLQVVFK